MGHSILCSHSTPVSPDRLDHIFEPSFLTRWLYLLIGMMSNISSQSIRIRVNITSFDAVFRSMYLTLEPDLKLLG